MKKALLTFLLFGFALDAFPQTLHAIFVSDVEDPKLGGISLRDEQKIIQILKTAEWGAGLKLKTYYHNRSSFTASAIRETVENLRVRSRDVVFFYYTGLGYYPNANSQFPAFKLKENALQPLFVFFSRKPPLSLDEVGDLLQRKGARLNIVMADCRDRTEDLGNVASAAFLDEDVRKVFLKKLFLGSCGLVKVASAKKGQQVWALPDDGSIYTENFRSTFNTLLESKFYGVRQATWPQLFEKAQSSTVFYRKDGKPIAQSSVFEIKACTAAQRRRTTRYASYRYSMTAGEIEKALKKYKDHGGNYNEVSREISRAFRRNAKIELIRQNKYPASDDRARKVTEQMSIGDYLMYFERQAAEIKYIGTDLGSVQRTANKEYLTSLTFIETYDEL